MSFIMNSTYIKYFTNYNIQMKCWVWFCTHVDQWFFLLWWNFCFGDQINGHVKGQTFFCKICTKLSYFFDGKSSQNTIFRHEFLTCCHNIKKFPNIFTYFLKFKPNLAKTSLWMVATLCTSENWKKTLMLLLKLWCGKYSSYILPNFVGMLSL